MSEELQSNPSGSCRDSEKHIFQPKPTCPKLWSCVSLLDWAGSHHWNVTHVQEPRIICLKELLLHLKQIVLQALAFCFVINPGFLCLALFCFSEQHPLIVFPSRDVWIIVVFKARGFVWLSINSCVNLHTSKHTQRNTGRWDSKEKMRRAD